MLCKNCKLEIRAIVDPWGYDERHSRKYGWFHVEATDNHSEGKYVTACPTEECDGEEAEPPEAA